MAKFKEMRATTDINSTILEHLAEAWTTVAEKLIAEAIRKDREKLAKLCEEHPLDEYDGGFFAEIIRQTPIEIMP